MKVRNKGGEKEKRSGEDGKSENERRVVVVGMKMDAQSRDILTWTLVKVAKPNDLVMVVHVLPSSTFSSDGKSSSSVDSAFNLNSMIASYDDFCNSNQITLCFSISHGSSARKAIILEVKRFQASLLVVGASNHSRGITGWTASTSFARYCSNKLSDDCSVLAVNNGKVVFRREAQVTANIGKESRLDKSSSKNSLIVVDGNGENSSCLLPPSKNGNKNGREVHQSSSKRPIILEASDDDDSFRLLPPVEASDDDDDESFRLLPPSKHENGREELLGGSSKDPLLSSDNSFRLLSTSLEHNSSTSKKRMFVEASGDHYFREMSERGSVSLAEEKTLPEKDSSDLYPLLPMEEEEQVHQQSYSDLFRPEGKKRGWVRLKKKEVYESKPVEKSKRPVIRWAMGLPNRRPEAMTKQSKELIPVGIDERSCSSDATDDEGSPVNLSKELEDLKEKFGSTCRVFSYEELADATSNFSPDNFIGKGGNSGVYKGILNDNQEVAVKIMKKSQKSFQEFVMEIEIITSVNHKNIIFLSGFCFNSKNLVLVYNLLSRGSLGDNLHGSKKKDNPIGWVERFKMAVGVAEALEYLHSHGGESSLPVIHGDVKSSNILLSNDYHPQLSDFGLATWCGSPNSSDTTPRTDVAGTFGYLPPEYLMLGELTEKVDVYAFGVVLLELLSGRMPIEYDHGKQSLVMWAKPILRSGESMRLLDQDLGSACDEDEVERMMLAASLCIKRAQRLRPKMVTVLEILRGNNEELLKWAKLQVHGEMEVDDDEEYVITFSPAEFQSHLNLALLDVEDDDEDYENTCPPAAEFQSHLNLALLHVEDDDVSSVRSVDHTLDYVMSRVSLEANSQTDESTLDTEGGLDQWTVFS